MFQNLQSQGSLAIRDANENTKGRTIFNSLLHFQGNFNIFHRMYRQKELCDVTLLVDDIEIPAHKMVLAASSLHFYMMFSRIGAKQNYNDQIVMQQIDGRTLLLLVDYMYTARICITEENVRDLLAAANLLVLSEVQDACCNFLKDQLSLSNCLGISNIAQDCHCLDLKTHADTYIEHNFLEVAKQAEFLALTYQQLSTILRKNNLNVPSEENVFESILAWVRQDQERRQLDLFSLMENVRLPLLSPKYLLQQLDDPLLKGSPLFNQLVLESLKCQYLEGDTKTSLHTIKSKPRQTAQSSKCLVVFGEASDRLSMEIYDFKQQKWMDGPKTIERQWKDNSAVAVCRGKFYVIGGESKSVDFYDPFQEVWWSSCDRMASELSNSITVLDDYIYAAGEYDRPIHSARRYDSQSGKWHEIAPMLRGKRDLSLGAMNGKIYAVGGYELSSTVDCYDPGSNSWSPLPCLQSPRAYPGVAELDGILYVIGGRHNNYLKSVDAFNPTTSCWSRIVDMQECRCSPGTVAMDGLLYVVGGRNNSRSTLNSVEVYDPKANAWTFLPNNMKTGKDHVYATAMDWPVNK